MLNEVLNEVVKEVVGDVMGDSVGEVNGEVARARAVAGTVCDPEIPVISIADLGVLRAVELAADGTVEVAITPTYSGCPALDAIRTDLERALHAAGFARVRVRTELAPAWSTDQITAAGREALRAYGIAPPAAAGPVPLDLSVRCPQCGSPHTEQTSRFAATACKALWRCRVCREPFEQFKTLS